MMNWNGGWGWMWLMIPMMLVMWAVIALLVLPWLRTGRDQSQSPIGRLMNALHKARSPSRSIAPAATS